MSGLPTNSSGCGPWIGFGLVFLIVCSIYPKMVGVAIGLVAFYVVLWLVCRFLFGDKGPIF